MPAATPQEPQRPKRRIRSAEAKAKAAFSTKAGNGTSLFAVPIDHRSVWARRTLEIYRGIVADRGGPGLQSVVAEQVIRRATGLTLLCEMYEAKFASGEFEESDIGVYNTLVNSYNRIAATVGLERRAKDVAPASLAEYMTAKAEAAKPAETAVIDGVCLDISDMEI
jgi:hypothetical protein